MKYLLISTGVVCAIVCFWATGSLVVRYHQKETCRLFDECVQRFGTQECRQQATDCRMVLK